MYQQWDVGGWYQSHCKLGWGLVKCMEEHCTASWVVGGTNRLQLIQRTNGPQILIILPHSESFCITLTMGKVSFDFQSKLRACSVFCREMFISNREMEMENKVVVDLKSMMATLSLQHDSQSTYGGFHLAQSWARSSGGQSGREGGGGASHGLVPRPAPLLNLHCTLHTAHWTLLPLHCTVDTTHCTLRCTAAPVFHSIRYRLM